MADNFFSKFTKAAIPDKTWLLRNADTFEEEKIPHADLIGDRGEIGDTGKDGIDGLDGRGIKAAEIDKLGFLIVTYSDGETNRVGKVAGDKGQDGSNGRDGAPGRDGKDGLPGFPGRDGKNGLGIDDATINASGELIVTFSDKTTKNLGRIVGRDGQSIQTNVGGGKVIDTAGLGVTGQAFRSIAVASQNTINAKTYRDILTIAAGSNVTLTTNPATRTLTIASTGGGGGSIPQANFSMLG